MARVAEMLGTPLMPWQRHVVDVAYEIDPATGRLAYREVRLTVPRQSGKTTLMLAAMTHRCLALGDRQRVSYTAQTGKDARSKWEDEHVPVLEASPFGKLIKVRRTNGSEAIRWPNGSLWNLLATTETAGHGAQLDLGVIDEAFALDDDRLEQSMKPAMITRPQPQLWVVSTAGTEDSSYLNDKIDDGRVRAQRGESAYVAYFEWSAPEDADPASEDTWRACMPALGITVPVEAIRSDFASMRLPEFCRAYLNQRQDRRAVQPWQVISEADWSACADEASQPVGDVKLALDVTPDRSMCAIGAAGWTSDGVRHVEVVTHRPGTSWVVDWFAAENRVGRYRSVTLDAAGPAGSLTDDLRKLGLEVREVSAREHAQACARLFDLAAERKLRHIDQVPLNVALAGAKKRPLGDAWLWHRRDSSVDVCPLVAVTLALVPDEPVVESSAPAIVSLADL